MRPASLLKEYASEIGIDHLGISPWLIWRRSPLLEERRDQLPPFLPCIGAKPNHFPDASSVIAIAIPTSGLPRPQIFSTGPGPMPDELSPAAQGELQQLANFLVRGAMLIAAVTGPIIDRFAAYNAGLGWYGLTAVFSFRRGSWLSG